MSKILGLFVVALIFIINIPSAFAANCDFSVTPDSPIQTSNPIKITVDSKEISNGPYQIHLKGPGSISLNEANAPFTTGQPASASFNKPVDVWPAGKYEIFFNPRGKSDSDKVCSTQFIITESAYQVGCETLIKTPVIDPNTNVIMGITGIKADNQNFIGSGGYDVYINGTKKLVYNTDVGSDIVLGKFNVGTYKVEIKNQGNITGGQQLQCPSVSFESAPVGTNGGGQIKNTNTGSIANIQKTTAGGIQCDSKKGTAIRLDPEGKPANPNEKPDGILTAIGCIPTDPATLINSLLRYASGAGGGIALILMIWGALEMIFSNGDPAKVTAGRDRFTAAIIGLVFILFSVVLLKIIGIDILGLNRLGAPFGT